MKQTFDGRTVREVAATLRVSQATVRRLIVAGKISAVRVGRLVRVDGCELQRLLKTGGVK